MKDNLRVSSQNSSHFRILMCLGLEKADRQETDWQKYLMVRPLEEYRLSPENGTPKKKCSRMNGKVQQEKGRK